MGVNLYCSLVGNNHQHDFSLRGGSVCGKRKHFPFSPLGITTKKACKHPPVKEGEWNILQSDAKQPNVEVVKSNNGKVSLSGLPFMQAAKSKTYKTFGTKEGEGTYGFVFSVIDVECPEKELVMKISLANSNFFTEVAALKSLQSSNKTPNVLKLHNWFISSELPPNTRHWGTVRSSLLESSQFKEPRSPYGFLVLEKATAGSLASFKENHIRANVQDAWKMVDAFLFQLIFTAAALPESSVIHRDIGGTNIMVTEVAADKNPFWHFCVGNQTFQFPRPVMKPVLIDYGSAHVLELGSSLRTDFRHTTLRYRAPEMIFLSPGGYGTLQPLFTPATDLFSIALSVIEMIVGDFTVHDNGKQYKNHPFLQYTPPALLTQKFKDYVQQLRTDETNPKKSYADKTWAGVLRSGFFTVEESSLLARYLWGMFMELGVPDDRRWPGVENTAIWKIMLEVISDQSNKGRDFPSKEGLLLKHNHTLRELLSAEQISCLLSMLRYNPKHRPSPIALLKSEIFDEFRVDVANPSPSSCWSVGGFSPRVSQSWE